MANREQIELKELIGIHKALLGIMDEAKRARSRYILEQCEFILKQMVDLENKVKTQFRIKQQAQSTLNYLREEIEKL